MMSHTEVEKAQTYFSKGFNCAQALLAAFGPQFGLDRENALKIAGAFGSGMGTGDACGAVTGALMVIGLKYAKVKGSGFFSRDRTEAVANEFVKRFKTKNGALACRDLLGCDLGTPEGRKAAKQEKHFKKRCPQYVQDAAEILEGMLNEGQA